MFNQFVLFWWSFEIFSVFIDNIALTSYVNGTYPDIFSKS